MSVSNPGVAAATLLAEIEIVEQHLHNRERWFGKSVNQSGNNWGTKASLTPFRAISGSGAFGSDTNDAAKVLGTEDTPAITGMVLFDLHQIMVEGASNATEFITRVIFGTGTMAEAEAAGQYSDEMLTEARKGEPLDHIMPRLLCGMDKVWVRVKNASNNAWIDFHVGLHEYAE